MAALLQLSRDSLQRRCEALPSSWQTCKLSVSDSAWEGGMYTRSLFELWFRAEGAREIGQAVLWENMIA